MSVGWNAAGATHVGQLRRGNEDDFQLESAAGPVAGTVTYNATTRVADEVLAAMTPFYRELYGNPHAIHSLGRRSHDAVEDSRAELARLLSQLTDSLETRRAAQRDRRTGP